MVVESAQRKNRVSNNANVLIKGGKSNEAATEDVRDLLKWC